MSGLYDLATWLVYAAAAVTMLAAIVAAILTGLVLRLAAEFLRELGGGPEEADTQDTGNYPIPPGG